MHTCGLARFGAKEALLFHPPELGPELELRQEEVLGYARYGTPVRPVKVGYSYKDAIAQAVTEVTGYAEPGVCFAINGGTGRPSVVQALVDAVYSALLELHPAMAVNDDDSASAFRYFPILEAQGLTLDIAPLFNVANYRHREIILALMEQDQPARARDLHEFINSTKRKEQRDTYDNFRRHLNGVRRWLKFVPGFAEEKADRYRYQYQWDEE